MALGASRLDHGHLLMRLPPVAGAGTPRPHARRATIEGGSAPATGGSRTALGHGSPCHFVLPGQLLDLGEADDVGAAPRSTNRLGAAVAPPADLLLEIGDFGVDRVDLLGLLLAQAPTDLFDVGVRRIALDTFTMALVARPRAVVPWRTAIWIRLRFRRPVDSIRLIGIPPMVDCRLALLKMTGCHTAISSATT